MPSPEYLQIMDLFGELSSEEQDMLMEQLSARIKRRSLSNDEFRTYLESQMKSVPWFKNMPETGEDEG